MPSRRSKRKLDSPAPQPCTETGRQRHLTRGLGSEGFWGTLPGSRLADLLPRTPLIVQPGLQPAVHVSHWETLLGWVWSPLDPPFGGRGRPHSRLEGRGRQVHYHQGWGCWWVEGNGKGARERRVWGKGAAEDSSEVSRTLQATQQRTVLRARPPQNYTHGHACGVWRPKYYVLGRRVTSTRPAFGPAISDC